MNDADFEARIETGASFGERGALRLEAAMYVGRNAHKFLDSGHAARQAMGKFLMLRRYAPLWRNNNAWLNASAKSGSALGMRRRKKKPRTIWGGRDVRGYTGMCQ